MTMIKKVDKITETFDRYCNPHKSVTWEWHTRNQQVRERYVTDLKTKVQICEFTNLKDSLICDYIICGIICDSA